MSCFSVMASASCLLSMVRIAQKNSNCKIEARTVRTLILFLYGTGALLSEAVSLRRDDLDFTRRTISFPSSRPYRSRTISMCPDLYNVLRRYYAATRRDIGSIPYLFLNRNGEVITAYALETTFRRLRQVAVV